MNAGKLFVCCDHGDAETYRLAFEQAFGHLFAPGSPPPAYLEASSAEAYAEDLRRLRLIEAATLMVVLVSRNARVSRRIDWEIATGLERNGDGPAAALLGIMLPDMPRRMAPEGAAPGVPFFDYQDMPPRLADNVRSGYARIYDWGWLCADERRVIDALSVAAASRREQPQRVDNGRPRLTRDLPSYAVASPLPRERRKPA